ncbi:hypothetical protein [Nocardioides convexus]|uniref:hypothetical protein n=1 Tax=Nocardioides convexus TaxID=2712224 RepID=UPI0024184F1C|nr:hypothetical protein [Nocardioides convexus]
MSLLVPLLAWTRTQVLALRGDWEAAERSLRVGDAGGRDYEPDAGAGGAGPGGVQRGTGGLPGCRPRPRPAHPALGPRLGGAARVLAVGRRLRQRAGDRRSRGRRRRLPRPARGGRPGARAHLGHRTPGLRPRPLVRRARRPRRRPRLLPGGHRPARAAAAALRPRPCALRLRPDPAPGRAPGRGGRRDHHRPRRLSRPRCSDLRRPLRSRVGRRRGPRDPRAARPRRPHAAGGGGRRTGRAGAEQQGGRRRVLLVGEDRAVPPHPDLREGRRPLARGAWRPVVRTESVRSCSEGRPRSRGVLRPSVPGTALGPEPKEYG